MSNLQIRPDWRLPERLATPESVYLDRRQLLAALGYGGLAVVGRARLGASASPAEPGSRGLLDPAVGSRFAERFPAPRDPSFELGDRSPTPEQTAARYNNFYEFTTSKVDVWKLAQRYPLGDWQVEVGGLVSRERVLDLDFFFRRFPLEERLYRFRCVERWAMQVPWTGFPLRRLVDELEPLASARYIRFVSFHEPERLPGQREAPWYPWPYFEALRLDEARHPLAFVAVGAYGHALPMQHGAPWRLAVPWKYGYKGPKSVVRIELVESQPETFWHQAASTEYGFFSNVDPDRPHPRWSQAEEQDIGTGQTRPTLPYNGYAQQIASLYSGDEF